MTFDFKSSNYFSYILITFQTRFHTTNPNKYVHLFKYSRVIKHCTLFFFTSYKDLNFTLCILALLG